MQCNPGTACIRIFGKKQFAFINSIYCGRNCLLPAILFIAVRCDKIPVFYRYKSYCAHSLRYFIVEDATPKPSGMEIVETSLMPTLINAMWCTVCSRL